MPNTSILNLWIQIYIHLYFGGVLANQEIVCAEPINGLLLLGWGSANDGNLGTKRLSKLDGNMAEPSEADDANVQARLGKAIVTEWAVDGDPGTEERGCGIQREAIRDAHYKVLFHDQVVREATIGDGAVVVDAVVGEDHLGAIVFGILVAAGACAAGADQAPNPSLIPYLKFRHLGPYCRHFAHNLVTAQSRTYPPLLDD